MKKITDINFQYSWEGWQKNSNDCKDLINKQLTTLESRLSAQQILESNWISTLTGNSHNEPIEINIDHLYSYSKMNQIGKAVSSFIALRLTENHIKDLKVIFQEFDKNGNGSIDNEEFKQGLEKFTKAHDLNNEDFKNLFDSIDLDNNGVITYNEFISGTFEKKHNQTKEMVYQAFKTFDYDKDVEISYQDLEKIINVTTEQDKAHLLNLFNSIDVNQNDKISFDELLHNIGD